MADNSPFEEFRKKLSLDEDSLSFGIEHEFLVYKYPPGSDLAPEDRVKSDIAASLSNDAGLKNVRFIRTDTGLNEPCLLTPVNPLIPLEYHYWNIVNDRTVLVDDEIWNEQSEDEHMFGQATCEVTTEVMYTGSSPKMTSQQRQSIHDVCKAIRGGHQVRIPRASGLHVHIDNEEWRDFAGLNAPMPQNMKDIVGAVKLRGQHEIAFKIICNLNKDDLVLKALRGKEKMSLSLVGTSQLANKTVSGLPMTVSNTVESRYMQGSLDPELICNYTDLWLGIYYAARFWSTDRFSTLFGGVYRANHGVGKNIGDTWPGVETLFKGLDLEHQLPFWKSVTENYAHDPMAFLSPLP